MADIIICIIIGLAVIFAVGYIIKAKRNGKKCIGCPYSENCRGSCSESKK